MLPLDCRSNTLLRRAEDFPDHSPLCTNVTCPACLPLWGRRVVQRLLGSRFVREVAVEAMRQAVVKTLRRNQLRGSELIEKPEAWLLRVARREACTVIRFHKRHITSEGVDEPTAPAPLDDEVCRLELIAGVRRAIATLPEDERKIVRLRVYEKFTCEQIAAALGIQHPHTVQRRLQGIVAKLQARLARFASKK